MIRKLFKIRRKSFLGKLLRMKSIFQHHYHWQKDRVKNKNLLRTAVRETLKSILN
jgi:hypothetical protein